MKGKRPLKKIILVLVEGQTEISALRDVISAVCDSINPELEVYFPMIIEDDCDVRGDITSKNGINPNTIEKCINKLFFKTFFDQYKIYPKDVKQVIHIIDMDGAYVNDECIVYDSDAVKTIYNNDSIMTNSREKIIERNRVKRENIDYLCSMTTICIGSKKPKYRAFFFSSNLDHFLFDDANIQFGKEKVDMAEEFSQRYVDAPEELIEFINAKEGALTDLSYEESWKFIRERNTNSLKPHTNINLLFKELMMDDDE